MTQDSGEPDNGLSKTFRRLLATAVSMPLVAIVGGTMAFYFSHVVGYIIVLAAVVTGIACLGACVLLRVSGRHLAKK
jgi:hypothetical protein